MPQCQPSGEGDVLPDGELRPELIKFGELVILGYNGGLPQGDKGRRRSKFVLYRRSKANGVSKSKHYVVKTPQTSQAVLDAKQHSISYTLNRNQAVIVEYQEDPTSDMFQIGRSSESPIDFVVMDTVPGNRVQDPGKAAAQSTISRFSCRILCSREDPEHTARVFAAGFDTSRNIFLGEKATKWETEHQAVDGLTTNGVLIMHPQISFSGADDPNTVTQEPGVWREVSVGGGIYGLRESRSAPTKGRPIPSETSELIDGTLIDICGATLLWRSSAGLARGPTNRELELLVDNLNAGRPQCPVGLNTLVVPRKNSQNVATSENQPYVYLNCGHVQGRHEWGKVGDRSNSKTCPICMCNSSAVKLTMGTEPAFYVDSSEPDYCFVPCGHMANSKTVKYWSSIPIPCGTSGFQSACPFCATPLQGTPGYTKLIFQDKCD
jgi:pellino protein